MPNYISKTIGGRGNSVLHNFKIYLIAILVVVFSSLGLTGCGGDKQANTGGDSKSVSTEQKTTAKESATELLAKGKKIEGMTCDYVLTTEGTTMQGKMWVQSDKVKQETSVQGQSMMMLYDGTTFYMYNPAEKMAIKYTASDMQGDGEDVDTPLDFTEEASDQAVTELETVNYEGQKCRVLLVKEKDSEDEVKMWVREDYGIPVCVEATDASGAKTVIEYKNLEVGGIPASTFELPEGVQVQDMSEMMNQMQNAPGN